MQSEYDGIPCPAGRLKIGSLGLRRAKEAERRGEGMMEITLIALKYLSMQIFTWLNRCTLQIGFTYFQGLHVVLNESRHGGQIIPPLKITVKFVSEKHTYFD